MNTNTLRRLNWLWKHRHTHDDDDFSEQLTIITGEIQQQVDSVAQGDSGAFVHFARGASQSIAVGGEAIEFDRLSVLGYAGFSSTPAPGETTTIPKAGYWNVDITAGWESFTGGGSVWVTRERGGSEIVVYPPADDPGIWTADDGALFEETAAAIPCRVGDLIRVYIDADDASAQTLAKATASIYLVDRVALSVSSCPVLGSPVTVTDVDHDAFPGFVIANDGTYVMAYREGTAHNSGDGAIYVRRSSDDGATWGSKIAVASGSFDWRGASLTKLSDGRIVLAAGIRTTAPAATTDGGYTFISSDSGATWDSGTRISDTFSDWSRVEGPVTELADGTWLLPIYGKDSGDTYWTVRVLSSTDDGATWTELADIADGPTDSIYYNETGMVRVGASTLVAFIRADDGGIGGSGDAIYRSQSTDDGATWSDPVIVIDGAGSCPKPHFRANGDIVLLLRNTSSGSEPYPGFLTRSSDFGLTWENCEDLTVDNYMVYGQSFEDPADLKLAMVIGDENAAGTASVIYFYREA